MVTYTEVKEIGAWFISSLWNREVVFVRSSLSHGGTFLLSEREQRGRGVPSPGQEVCFWLGSVKDSVCWSVSSFFIFSPSSSFLVKYLSLQRPSGWKPPTSGVGFDLLDDGVVTGSAYPFWNKDVFRPFKVALRLLPQDGKESCFAISCSLL